MPTPPPIPPPSPDQLQTPLVEMLRPLVGLLIKSGMTFPAAADMMRQLYVQVAEQQFKLEGKRQTDSRISLITGVHRKEVNRLREAGTPVSNVPAAVSRSSRILARWTGSPDYSDPVTGPRPLPRASEKQGDPSFDALVASVTRDVRPRAVLDEWLRQGIAGVDSDGRISLRQSAYIPKSGDEKQLYYFGRNLRDHIAAAAGNVAGAQPPHFERAVNYESLSPDLAGKLEALARELAMEALTKANRAALAGKQGDAGGGERWIFGTYIYRERGPGDDGEPET